MRYIDESLMESDGCAFMFGQLPEMFHKPDCALLDRFHGFIKGWHIPVMNDDLKIAGWGLNKNISLQYFMSYAAIARTEWLLTNC